MSGIAVVQTAFLGDIVLTTPLLREIKRVRPELKLTVVTTALGRDILSGHPAIDSILVHDKRGADRGPAGVWRAMKALRELKLDAIVAAQRSSRTGLLVRGSGAQQRIGFANAPGRWAYTDRVPWVGTEHATRRYLALSTPLGGSPAKADPTPMLAVSDHSRATIAALLANAGVREADRVLAIAPGSIWGTKRWTPEGFAEVARAARERGLATVLIGGPEDAPVCREIAASAGGAISVLAGVTSVADLPALLARATALVGNDSGAGHVASAVGTPVVVIFGPTVPAFGYTPWGERNRIVEHQGLDCRPCDSHGPQTCPLGHHRCMKEIAPERALAALDAALS